VTAATKRALADIAKLETYMTKELALIQTEIPFRATHLRPGSIVWGPEYTAAPWRIMFREDGAKRGRRIDVWPQHLMRAVGLQLGELLTAVANATMERHEA
jgi:hypothetical protein